MNETARELDLIRTQLRAAIERDLHDRSPRVRVTHRRSFRLAIPTLSVLAAATAAIVLGLTLSAASPSGASAAARRALAATAAAPSGTMTTTVLHAGVTQHHRCGPLERPRHRVLAGVDPIPQLLLIGGGMYVQTSDGSWLHYANASDVGPKPLGGLAQLAQDNIAGTTPQQILALATGVQTDGATGRHHGLHRHDPEQQPRSSDGPGNNAITSMILGAQKRTDMMFGAGTGRRPWRPASERSPAPDERRRRRPRQAGQRDLPAGRHLHVERHLQPAWQHTADYGTLQFDRCSARNPAARNAAAQNGGQPPAQTITPADQADYLKAAACMRSHGIPDFPDPTFQNNTVTFNIPPNIDPNSSQARSAVATCQKLIPTGLPYSSSTRTASPH